MLIPAKEFAQVATDLYKNNNIPYKRGGRDIRGMDSSGFINYCLSQCGYPANFVGTNDIYRNAGTRLPFNSNELIPGMILLPVEHNGGEPDKYKCDGLGNAPYAAIYCGEDGAIYPSEKRGSIISANLQQFKIIVLCKYIDYDGISRDCSY